MKVGIYKITSPSGKIYIGQSQNLEKRIKDYPKNCHNQVRLRNSFLKYGSINHQYEIIEECSFKDLNKRERYWQDFYIVIGSNGLNCILTNPEIEPKAIIERIKEEPKEKLPRKDKGVKRSKEILEKMSAGRKGKGKKLTNEKTGEIFNTIGQAAKSLNMNYSTLACMILGQNPNKTDLKFIINI